MRYVDRFLRAQREARQSGAGLWGSCIVSEPGQGQGVAGGDNGNCDSSYPEVCIPPPPPYLNCEDVSYNDIKVVGADPHEFDGNDDGVGCET